MWDKVFTPASVMEALDLLNRHHPDARIIAGGTDLVMQLQAGEKRARVLVDITHINVLHGIRLEQDEIVIGAGVTHAEISSSLLIRESVPCLSAAATEVGSPQIRAVATVGGNIVNAQPAADTALALVAMGAKALVQTREGPCCKDVLDLYDTPGVSFVDSTNQILVEFRFKKPCLQSSSAYRRLGKCKSIALPVLCAAASVELDDEGQLFQDSLLVLGPVAPRPLLVTEAAEFLQGKPVSKQVIAQAAQIARECANPRDSLLRCSAEYREEMVEVIVRSVLTEAVEKIQSRVVVNE